MNQQRAEMHLESAELDGRVEDFWLKESGGGCPVRGLLVFGVSGSVEGCREESEWVYGPVTIKNYIV